MATRSGPVGRSFGVLDIEDAHRSYPAANSIDSGDMSPFRRLAQTGFAALDFIVRPLAGPRILIYHQVGSGVGHEMNVTVTAFERQLETLQQIGEILPLEAMIRRRGDPGSERLFALTFDDGYADVYRNAYPVMRRLQVPFTLYLTSGPIEAPREYPRWPGEPMTWDQVTEMIGSGLVTVGAHTHTHPDLRQIDPSAVEHEVGVSNQIIGDRVGILPRHFTYPKGWWSPTADGVIRRVYDTATVGMGSPVKATSDLHALGRVSVLASDSEWAFGRKLVTGGRTEALARRLRHGYRGL